MNKFQTVTMNEVRTRNLKVKQKGIFSEIDEPLDFNENMSTNIVLNAIS